jgi:short-subunit dehydrogenase
MKKIFSPLALGAMAGLLGTWTVSSLIGLRRRSSMRGKVAVVCGGSRGLGRAVARELARKGASVAICARSPDDLESASAELASFGVPVLAAVCDLRSEDDTRAFLGAVAATLGDIDVLVANAATLTVAPIEATSASDFHEAMGSIFDTALHPALAVLPAMQARRAGTIALITSIGGKIGVPHLAPYSAAKFAVVGFAEALRAEVKKDAVHVLTVVPGLMRTGSHLRAKFRGDPEKELAWFGASAIAPVLSIDADRAARRIVRSIARGDRELVYTPAARIAVRTHDLAPSLWSFVMSLAGRMLPRIPERGHVTEEEGRTVTATSSSRWIDLLRARSLPLASRHGQATFGPRQ